MDYLFVGSQEISALTGLPYIHQIAYLFGIRRHMDRQTLIVGIKRRISYQSLAETLYVEPHQGLKNSGSPSKQQLRRIIQSLARAGLIEIQSDRMRLVLKCLLATSGFSAQKKPDTNPTQKADINKSSKNNDFSSTSSDINDKSDSVDSVNANTPPNKENYYLFLSTKFKNFWSLYPNKKSEPQAFAIFQALNPDELLCEKIMNALQAQINNRDDLIAAGLWVPPWKYPANWLKSRSWNDELTVTPKESNHAKNERCSKQAPGSTFENVFGDVDFEFGNEENDAEYGKNVTAIGQGRRS